MAETGAVFGGEHSGHFYFRDFWYADSGMLAALHVLAALGEQQAPLSEILAGYGRYVATGELNSEVQDQAAATERVRAEFASPARHHHRRARRADHHRRRLVVQPAPVQHRAVAAAEPGGGRRGHYAQAA